MNRLTRVLAFFRPDRGRVVLSLGLLVLAIGANLLKPWPVALLADSVLGTQPLPDWLAGQPVASNQMTLLTFLGVSVLLLHFVHGGLKALQNYWIISTGLCGLARVREAVYQRLLVLSQRFHQGKSSGDTLYRATWDTYAFQTLFQQGMMTFVEASITLVLMVIIMWRMDSTLTIYALIIMPLLVISIRIFSRTMNTRGAAAQQADSQVAAHLQQSLVNLPLIQGYATEKAEGERFLNLTQGARAKRLGQHLWELFYGLGVALVFGIGTALIVWLGGQRVLEGEITIGDLLVFLAYLAMLYEPLNQLSHVGATVSTATASAQRVFDLLDADETVPEKSNARAVITEAEAQVDGKASGKPLVMEGALEFENVGFEYVSGRPILKGLSFEVKPGELVAIIGPSGAGKSTLLQLVTRFFDPTSGKIKLDGVDLRDLKLADLRKNIAFVLQEPLLLPATVAENIGYGLRDASRADIEAAAKTAHAHEFIMSLPKGYDTVVGEGAARLSVGEKQRLNLARAYLKDAPVLLLDEPTSSLDIENETLIAASLQELRKGRTTLVVAHRLNTIRNADRVVVVVNGKVFEQGRPEELLGSKGYLAEHWAKFRVTV
jgi:ATP-binding cassette subfamily B protein/subfamily B ATP-binding cassette protein MsbA